MSDIFISYSSKDKEKADQLSELLASAGLSVWIDQSGIEISASWSKEIVQAINECKAFVVLLSPSSILSHNVIKEVSLASEKRKKILPLDLEPVQLPDDLEYQLAGIHRAPMTNIDAIIRALGKLGLQATSAPTYQIVKSAVETRHGASLPDERKSLMILPFQDLSPTGDNGWFADGIVSEMIQALSNVKALHLTDAQSTKDFKRYHGTLPTYAKEMGIRYFVEGDVRKFGDQIKINSRLLDIESGDHLWQDSMKGTMSDIFDIQEKVAEKVVEGLRVHLASEEKKKLIERGTENAEAYELYMKANEYFDRQTKEGFRLALQLITEAIKLDIGYAKAHQFKAIALVGLYRDYDRDLSLLNDAEALCKEALMLKPDFFVVYYPLSLIYIYLGKLTEAEEFAKEFIRKDPQNFMSYFTLGFFYMNINEYAKAIAPLEESVRLKPDHLTILWNLVSSCDSAGIWEKCAHWAEVSLPLVQRYLKLHPDDEKWLVGHALLLFNSGRTEAARMAAIDLKQVKDGLSLYNTAYFFCRLGDKEEALVTLRKAIEAGLNDTQALNEILTDENKGVATLSGSPEYEEVKRMVEEIEARVKNNG